MPRGSGLEAMFNAGSRSGISRRMFSYESPLWIAGSIGEFGDLAPLKSGAGAGGGARRGSGVLRCGCGGVRGSVKDSGLVVLTTGSSSA